mgnify:CR=1 FL=1
MADCGYAAVVLKKPLEHYASTYGAVGGAPYFMSLMLSALQHRGQQSAGFMSYNPEKEVKRLDGHKDVGLVNEVFSTGNNREFRKLLDDYAGTRAIGHVRWETSGSSKTMKEKRDEAQPFHRHHGRAWKRFGIVWNGTLANYSDLKDYLVNDVGYTLDTRVDTEIFMHMVARGLAEESDRVGGKPKFLDVAKNFSKRLDGGYCVAILDAQGMLAVVRDPFGIMPSCYGENEDFFAAASESVALTKIGMTPSSICVHHAGELLLYDEQSARERFAPDETGRPCFFQLQYLASPDSLLDGVHVEAYRKELGREAAREIREKGLDVNGFVVMPIPQTSFPIAETLAQSLGLQYVPALKKDSDMRVYIGSKDQRSLLMDLKFNRSPINISGMDIMLVDDSIVRGETGGRLVHLVRTYFQPRRIYFVSATPPLRNSCCYGADIGVFGTHTELVANQHPVGNLEQMLAKQWEIDRVIYITEEGVKNVQKSFGIANSCMACVNADYPTDYGKKLLEERLKHG